MFQIPTKITEPIGNIGSKVGKIIMAIICGYYRLGRAIVAPLVYLVVWIAERAYTSIPATVDWIKDLLQPLFDRVVEPFFDYVYHNPVKGYLIMYFALLIMTGLGYILLK
jgi:hypothetical protein